MTLEKQELDRIETAKTAIGTAIAGKGVAVPSGTKLDSMAALIEGIEQGSDPVLQEKTVTPATSAQSVTPDSGYDGLSKVTVNAMPTATQATPSISVSSDGLITASATQTAGYVAAGTKSATKQLTTQAAQTITPGTADQTIQAGQYLSGVQTIKGDANLIPANIAKGVSIFGVAGTMEAGGGSGGTVEACSVDYDLPAEDGFIFYVDDYGDPCTEAFKNSAMSQLQSVAIGSALVMFFEGTPNNDLVCENAEFIEGHTSESGLSVYTFKIYGDARITFG